MASAAAPRGTPTTLGNQGRRTISMAMRRAHHGDENRITRNVASPPYDWAASMPNGANARRAGNATVPGRRQAETTARAASPSMTSAIRRATSPERTRPADACSTIAVVCALLNRLNPLNSP